MKEVCKKGTNILTFYIFESGAEYGAKCIAESGAKQYFIQDTYPSQQLHVQT